MKDNSDRKDATLKNIGIIGKLNAAIYRSLQSIINSRLEDLPIRSGQHDFFHVIAMREGLSQKELSEALYIGKSTTAKAVKSLIAEGYVRKEKDLTDQRVDRLYLTEEGRKVVGRIMKTFKETIDITARGMSNEEIDETVHLLKKILSNLNEEKDRIHHCD